MSDIVAVVYNNDITASVTSGYQTGNINVLYNNDITSNVTRESQTVVSAVGIQGASGSRTNLEYSTNVDATNLENGSILIYNTNSSLWVASRHLNAQDMDAGEY